jgi:hypothetical protein
MSCPCSNCSSSQTTTTTLNCTPVNYCVDGCPDILDSKCIVYKGDDLTCTLIEANDTIEDAIVKLDTAICGITNDSDDKMVRISSADTTSGYLEDKIIAGDYITVDKLNTGLNESLEVNVDYAALSGLLVQTPLVVTSTDNSIFFAQSGTANHTVNLKVNVSGDAGNIVQMYADGLYVQASEVHKVMSNNLDEIPDYLESKIVAGSNITLTSVPYTVGSDNGYRIRIDAATSISPNLTITSPDSSITIVQGGTQGHVVTLACGTTADNGLTKTLNNTQLGGVLIQDTYIDAMNYNFLTTNANAVEFYNLAGMGLGISPTDTNLTAINNLTLSGENVIIEGLGGSISLTASTDLTLTAQTVTITPSGSLELVNIPTTTLGTGKVLFLTAANEVKNFDLAAYIGATTVTGGNGLTKSGSTIKLGGSLTELTTVNTTGFTLNFSKSTNSAGNVLATNHSVSFTGAATTDSTQSFYAGIFNQVAWLKASDSALHADTKMGASLHSFYFVQAGNITGTAKPGIVSIYALLGSTGNIPFLSNIAIAAPKQASGFTYTGVITDYYGIYIEDLASSDCEAQLTNKYGIYQAGTIDSNYFGGPTRFVSGIKWESKAGDPGTSDIADGYWGVWKNTSTGDIKLWANNGGVMESSAALA